jgi:hypothetical protein
VWHGLILINLDVMSCSKMLALVVKLFMGLGILEWCIVGFLNWDGTALMRQGRIVLLKIIRCI